MTWAWLIWWIRSWFPIGWQSLVPNLPETDSKGSRRLWWLPKNWNSQALELLPGAFGQAQCMPATSCPSMTLSGKACRHLWWSQCHLSLIHLTLRKERYMGTHSTQPARGEVEGNSVLTWWDKILQQNTNDWAEDGSMSLAAVFEQSYWMISRCHGEMDLAKALVSNGEASPLVVDFYARRVRFRTFSEQLVGLCEMLLAQTNGTILTLSIAVNTPLLQSGAYMFLCISCISRYMLQVWLECHLICVICVRFVLLCFPKVTVCCGRKLCQWDGTGWDAAACLGICRDHPGDAKFRGHTAGMDEGETLSSWKFVFFEDGICGKQRAWEHCMYLATHSFWMLICLGGLKRNFLIVTFSRLQGWKFRLCGLAFDSWNSASHQDISVTVDVKSK